MNTPEELAERIEALRKRWGTRLLILAHHYQRPLVIHHADAVGDSLELARTAARRTDAERIVLCGVRFMAESAAILAQSHQTVYMPEPLAGCPMADMAETAAVQDAWATLRSHASDWLPVVYVNSSAAVKALCGRWGGSTCTSSNAARVFQWVFHQGQRVFFIPDEHLGTNTACKLGIPREAIALYDPKKPSGGLDPVALRQVRVVVWKGYCIVHTAFTPEQIREARRLDPRARIIVHPETPYDAATLADAQGSTSQIIQYVRAAEAGCTVLVGTEVNLVARLAEEQRGRITVKALFQSSCANMGKTNAYNLLHVLENWPERHAIHVPADIQADARLALERMLSL